MFLNFSIRFMQNPEYFTCTFQHCVGENLRTGIWDFNARMWIHTPTAFNWVALNFFKRSVDVARWLYATGLFCCFEAIYNSYAKIKNPCKIETEGTPNYVGVKSNGKGSQVKTFILGFKKTLDNNQIRFFTLFHLL